MTRYTLRSQRPPPSGPRDPGGTGGPGGPGGPPGDGPRVFTVSELVGGAGRLLETTFATCWVTGEVSNLKIVTSGHAYFTLKDQGAVLPVAMWRSALARLRFRLEPGQSLRVLGRLGIYPAQGKFQLYAERAEPAGLGAMMLELEQRRRRLTAEGLFDRERKRPLPPWPRRIGVVTSATGAAIHDILKVIRQRCPSRILLAPALVQGDEAPASLRRALARLTQAPDVDVIILGRGGGALEDLWAFNDEALVRAVAASPVPVISAVGHEVDTTLVDFAADARAATPSHAAELAVPDAAVFHRRVDDHRRRLVLAFTRRIVDERGRLELLQGRLRAATHHRITGPRRRLQELLRRLHALHPRQRLGADRRRLTALHRRLLAHHPQLRVQAARRRLAQLHGDLERRGRALPQGPRLRLVRAASALDALSPLRVLERGYAVVSDRQGAVIADASQVELGDRLTLRLRRGALDVEVRGRREGDTD